MAKPHSNQSQSGSAPPDEPSAGERITGLIGLVLLVALLAYLFYQAGFAGDKPPDITVAVLGIEPNGEDYLVRFEVRNHGDQTAAAVQIEGELRMNGTVIERAAALIDYAPAESVQQGGLFFTRDPRGGELRLHASGYQRP